jgi:SAM-dependent methyltransferase
VPPLWPGQTVDVLHDADGYGEAFADVYDEWYGQSFDTDGAVELLARLAGPGPVLELGVGTGRLAVPLADQGLTVIGVDASPRMLEQLAAKPGGEAVVAVLADMADVGRAVREVAERSRAGARPVPAFGYRLAFCAYNTFLNLHTEAAQRGCLEGTASLLAPDGALVVEAYVPATPGEVARTSLDVARVTTESVVLTATEHDPDAQVVTGQHVELRDGSVRLRPWRIRYLTTDQLDAMAADAGLHLADRWADWRGAPFEERSSTHVSLYRRDGRG